MNKNSFDNAKICFNQAQSLFQILKITYYSDLINLQNGIIYKNKGNNIAAKNIFNTLIAIPDTPSIFDTKAEALYQIGSIEMDENRNNLALNYFKKALELNLKTLLSDKKF